MKTTKRILTTLLAVIMLFGVVVIAAEAANLSTTKTNYGYMITTDAKISKAASTVKVYGDYDYLNFYINSNYNNMYFFYEIYSDKQMTKMVAGDYTYCKSSGEYSWSPKIKLKGVLNSGTYYGATYAAKIDGSGNAKISEPSLQQFKLVVNRKPEFKQQMVILKSVTTTVNGPVVKWSKLSNDVSKYVIYRRNLTGTKWTKAGTVKGSTLSFTDKSVKDKNGKFVYTVRALNKSGVGTRYLYNGLTCLFARAPKISSVSTVSDNRVKVKWNNTSNSAYYKVYRSENGGKWKAINSKFKGTTYYDTTAENGKNYKYTVKAVIRTSYGNAVSAYYKSTKTVDFLVAPKLNPVTVVENGLNITWEKVEGAENYTVFRKTLEKGAKWVNLGEVSADVAEYVDTTANEESSFIYTIRADGEKSKGSYLSKGVEYFTLAQPEFTTTLNKNIIHIEWKPVDNAEGYYILIKDGSDNWSVYQNITVGNKCDISISTTYAEYELTVQAYRGDKKSTYKEDVEKIEYWATATAKYEIYNDVINFNDDGRSDTTYKLYKKLASEPDSEYELVSTDYSYYVGYPVSLSDKTEVLYDTPYVYQVRMTYNDKEQSSNFQTIKLIKYNPEKYISKFNVVSRKVNECCDGGYFPSHLFDFEKNKKDLAESFYEKVYIKSGNNWYELNSSENWTFDSRGYDLKSLDFSYVVSDKNGSTPIDGMVVNVSNPKHSDFVSPIFEVNSKGLNIRWNDLEEVEEYKVIVYGNYGKQVYETVVEDTNEKNYNVIMELDDSTHKSFTFRITAINAAGNKSEYYGYTLTTYKAPTLIKAQSTAKGVIEITFNRKVYCDDTFRIYRKAEGETKWKAVGSLLPDNSEKNIVYKDNTVKSGVKYTYTVRVFNPFFDSNFVSYYDTKGISAVAK